MGRPQSQALRAGLHGTRRVLAEDHAVCEGQQSVARQITEDQRLSPACEKRIGWFEETYAAEVSAAGEPAPQPPM